VTFLFSDIEGSTSMLRRDNRNTDGVTRRPLGGAR
jgi:hypothetical protein